MSPPLNTIKNAVLVASLYLIYQFVRGFFPVAELPSSGTATLTTLFALGMMAGIVGWLHQQYTAASKTGEKPAAGGMVLPVVGLLAGLGLLAMQLIGHPRVELPPRPVTPSSVIPSTPRASPAKTEAAESRATFLRAQFYAAVSAHDRLHEVTEKTRWVQNPDTNAFKPGGINKQDLADYQHAMRDMIAAADKILTQLNYLDAANAALPGLVREFWKTERQVYAGIVEQVSLLEANWSEWNPNGFNEKDPALKPWQKKVVQLQEEAARNLTAANNLRERLRAEEGPR